jgi:hypothetical protein
VPFSPFACSCGTVWAGNAGRAQLPRTYTWSRNYYALAYGLPSLACQGKAVVRSVFKQNNMQWDRPGCADFRLRADFEGNTGRATAVVRCELALPSGGGSEAERALRSREVNCRICNACGDGEWLESLQRPACLEHCLGGWLERGVCAKGASECTANDRNKAPG